MALPAEKTPSPLDSLREVVEGTAELATALSPYCSSTADLVGMLELALANDGQLRLVAELVEKHNQRKQGAARR